MEFRNEITFIPLAEVFFSSIDSLWISKLRDFASKLISFFLIRSFLFFNSKLKGIAKTLPFNFNKFINFFRQKIKLLYLF